MMAQWYALLEYLSLPELSYRSENRTAYYESQNKKHPDISCVGYRFRLYVLQRHFQNWQSSVAIFACKFIGLRKFVKTEVIDYLWSIIDQKCNDRFNTDL